MDTSTSVNSSQPPVEAQGDKPGFYIYHWPNSYMMMPICDQSELNSEAEVPTYNVQERDDDTPITVSDCPDLNDDVMDYAETEAPEDMSGFCKDQQAEDIESFFSNSYEMPNYDQYSLNNTPEHFMPPMQEATQGSDESPSTVYNSPVLNGSLFVYFELIKSTKPSPEHSPRTYCNSCSRAYSSPSELNRHKKRCHLGQRNHLCDRCGYNCFEMYRLKVHACGVFRKRFTCKSCGAKFCYRYEMNEHILCTCKKVDRGNM